MPDLSPNEQTDPNLVVRWPIQAWVARLLIPASIVVSVAIAASAWYGVKIKRHSVRVTGSATERITSDLIEWDSTIRHRASTRAEAYREVRRDVDKTVAYLEGQGLQPDEIRVSSTEVSAVYETEYEQIGEEVVPHDKLAGFRARQTITVTSKNVEKVEQISRAVTALLDQDIPIESDSPLYHYTGLEDLKIEMLAAAATDARERATRILAAAGDDELGAIVDTHMGVININPANSTATSWDGNNDKTSLEKDIFTVVHVTYEVD